MTKPRRAQYELQTALLDGLFESTRKVKDGALRLRQVDAHFDYHSNTDGKTYPQAIYLRLRVPYLLNPQAESVLLALLQLLGQDRQPVNPQETDVIPWLLEPEEAARVKDAGIVLTTEYELLQAAGMNKGGKSYKLLRLYLEQMAEIRVHYENHATRWRGSDWFLRHKVHEDGRLVVQINWRLAGAIFGSYLYAEIDLDERYALQKDASKTLHRWLSAHLWPGKSSFLKYDTLVRHVWSEPAAPKTQQKRQERLKRELLPDIGQLPGWTITLEKEGTTIARHPTAPESAAKPRRTPQ